MPLIIALLNSEEGGCHKADNNFTMNTIREITPSKALAMLQKGALLVDVREAHEVSRKSFDVPSIIQIPLRELEHRFKEIPQNRQLIIACHSGSRSIVATRFLVNHGYRKALNMQYGMSRWAKEGLPVNKKEKQSIASGMLQKFGWGK